MAITLVTELLPNCTNGLDCSIYNLLLMDACDYRVGRLMWGCSSRYMYQSNSYGHRNMILKYTLPMANVMFYMLQIQQLCTFDNHTKDVVIILSLCEKLHLNLKQNGFLKSLFNKKRKWTLDTYQHDESSPPQQACIM